MRGKRTLKSVCRELPLLLLAAEEAPVYRLRMNRCGSRAKLGALKHNFIEMGFRTDQAGAFAKASTDKPKLLLKPGQFTQGV
jgi:hypothetical protein